MILPCKKNVLAELKKVSKEIESRLEEWKKEIEDCREKFYDLNYYTTRQLLILRKELGQIKYSAASTIGPQVLTLLQYISSSVTCENVNTAAHKYFKQQRRNPSLKLQKSEDTCLVTECIQTTDENNHKLTPKQRQLYMHLTTQLGYDYNLALAAVDNFPEEYDAINWCIEKTNEGGQEVVDVQVNFQDQECPSGYILDYTKNDNANIAEDNGKKDDVFLF